MRNLGIWQYFAGDNVMFTIGNDKYVGTLKRDHNKFHQALLLVGIFNLDQLLFKHVLEIDKKKAKMEKDANKVSIFKLSSISDVEKTEINRSSFTHVSNKEMLYSNIYEPDERVVEYEKYNDALTKVDDLMQWHAEASTIVSDMEQIDRIIKETQEKPVEVEVITYNLPINIEQHTIQPTNPICDAINQPILQISLPMEPPTIEQQINEETKIILDAPTSTGRIKYVCKIDKSGQKRPGPNDEYKHATPSKKKRTKIKIKMSADYLIYNPNGPIRY